MSSMPSRRAILVAGAAVLAAGVAGCTAAVKALATSASPSGPSSAPPASIPSTLTTQDGPTSASATPQAPTNPTTATHPTTKQSTTKQSTTNQSTTTPARTARTSAPPAGPAVEVMSGPTRTPALALTFHGAGDVSLARAILQIAKDKRAKITVMAVGSWLGQNPEMAAEILAGGHELGNHTYSHLDINSLPADEISNEIVRCRDVLAKLTGSPGSYFRQSQAQHATDQVRTLAGAAGYRTCLSYNLDSMDYTDPGGDAVRSYLKAATNGSIVSMHLGHQSTVDALPAVLDDLGARGLRPVTVSTLLRG